MDVRVNAPATVTVALERYAATVMLLLALAAGVLFLGMVQCLRLLLRGSLANEVVGPAARSDRGHAKRREDAFFLSAGRSRW